MLEHSYSGKPFTVVAARKPEAGFDMVTLINPKDVMTVELSVSALCLLSRKALELTFIENEPLEIALPFYATAELSLDKSSTPTMTIDNHERMVNSLFVDMVFGLKVSLLKNASEEYTVTKTVVKDLYLEDSGFRIERNVFDARTSELLWKMFDTLDDQDINDPQDEITSVKNQALTDIFNSIDFIPLITGQTFTTRKL